VSDEYVPVGTCVASAFGESVDDGDAVAVEAEVLTGNGVAVLTTVVAPGVVVEPGVAVWAWLLDVANPRLITAVAAMIMA
jgi:hypothetical protein